MLSPIKVIDIELSHLPLPTLTDLAGYMSIQALVRLQGVPLGVIKAPILNGQCDGATLGKIICEQQGWAIVAQILKQGLYAGTSCQLQDLAASLKASLAPVVQRRDTIAGRPAGHSLPKLTIAVCTRDRAADLAICLDALIRLDYPHLELLVIDNAPTSQASAELVAGYPQVRYVCEPRPGLNWARNRAILAATGDIIAYTDDDVVVDPQWASAIAQVFSENPEVMAMTGLVVPYELETQAQCWFELYGGFGRGCQRKWYRRSRHQPLPHWFLGTGAYGTGANMAYRRSVFAEIGYFDPALDVGTVTNGGGDLEMLFRVLQAGHTLVYEPNALIRHRHRRDYAKLRTQIANNGIGLLAYLVRTGIHYPEQRRSIVRIVTWWLVEWILIRAWVAFKYPAQLPAELIQVEFWGGIQGLTRYFKARRQAQQIAADFAVSDPVHPDYWSIGGGSAPSGSAQSSSSTPNPAAHDRPKGNAKVAVRSLDLSQPLQPIDDLDDYATTHLFLHWQDQQLLGQTDIVNDYQPIAVIRLADAILDCLGVKLLSPAQPQLATAAWHRAQDCLWEYLVPEHPVPPLKLPVHIPVSVNITTYDRPDDLRNCLRGLVAQATDRAVEIIVVDNHPNSGLTAPVVAEFTGVKLVNEPRQGISYARNTGFLTATGDIVIATDDDVSLPSNWLEKIVAPFARPDVMVVTGNVLPLKLETPSQQFFEKYGGLGRGFEQFEVGRDWFDHYPRVAVPTWHLGATANAAFRRTIFSDAAIGLMEEMLGAGMPAGVGEDTYVFYKVLKAGYTIWYEPSAYVQHKHRESIKALRRQLYSYSRGHVAYHLVTWLKDGDWRSWVQILVVLPSHHLSQLRRWVQRQSDYPLSLTLLEIWGNLGGPWALWRSYRRVKRRGRNYAIGPQQSTR